MASTLARDALRTLCIAIYVGLLAEAFVRVFSPSPIMPRFVGATDYGIRGNVPGARYWHYTLDDSVEYRINSQGIRADREIPLQKSPDSCRVVLLGDSFFMGYEVDLKDSFAFVLESLLQSSGYRCEVINLAVSGYGHAEMLIALQARGLQFQPDLVIFQWHRTDPDDNVRSGLFGLGEQGALQQTAREYLPAVRVRALLSQLPPYRWIEQHSQLYSALRERIALLFKRGLARQKKAGIADSLEADNANKLDYSSSNDELPYSLLLTHALLREAAALSSEAGADFMIFEVPIANGRTDFRPVDQRLTDALANELWLVSPISAFRAAASEGMLIYYENGAGHWSPLGNQVAARVAQQAIIERGIPGSTTSTPRVN